MRLMRCSKREAASTPARVRRQGASLLPFILAPLPSGVMFSSDGTPSPYCPLPLPPFAVSFWRAERLEILQHATGGARIRLAAHAAEPAGVTAELLHEAGVQGVQVLRLQADRSSNKPCNSPISASRVREPTPDIHTLRPRSVIGISLKPLSLSCTDVTSSRASYDTSGHHAAAAAGGGDGAAAGAGAGGGAGILELFENLNLHGGREATAGGGRVCAAHTRSSKPSAAATAVAACSPCGPAAAVVVATTTAATAAALGGLHPLRGETGERPDPPLISSTSPPPSSLFSLPPLLPAAPLPPPLPPDCGLPFCRARGLPRAAGFPVPVRDGEAP
eukprot:CAMPEP_0179858530 /NCGR_PEP_ID=MMETSP0982-20121206/12461_1 /TAXON_ID=483367 /ORGANISM="non described non described, Strain CCMP 2436" /LENGTH=332 /DNA_ID=CAMNT_0021745379 /DNA_START=649 /DNA_END=1649 /DNA_ORIENTATION=-